MAAAILAYIIYLLIVLAINAAVIYHFTKYSFPGDINKVVMLFYSLILISIIAGTFFLVGVI